jgi:DNA-binding response OmpR family regulator
MRVLLVEDDANLRWGLTTALRGAGLIVDYVGDGLGAVRAATDDHYNAIVLDLGLPDIDGLEVLRRLRRSGCRTPILILTARDAPCDRVKGLDQGADDYLPKPFELSEFEARVRALIRRGQGIPEPTLTIGKLTLERLTGEAHIEGRPLELRRREFLVLEALMVRQGKTVPRERLVAEVFGSEDMVAPNALEVYVTRVRRKIEGADLTIHAIRGLGYVLKYAI